MTRRPYDIRIVFSALRHARLGVAVKRGMLLLLAAGVLAVGLWPSVQTGTARLLAQEESPVATPAPTRSREVVNRLRVPEPGDAIARTVAIEGTALLPQFNRYEIHLSPAGMESWQWLTSSHRVIYDDVLFMFDTTAYPDGLYDLRARAINDGGNYSESFVRGVEIRNANPPTPTPLPGATSVPFSALPVPTVTPTPDPRREGESGKGFFAPDTGAVVRGDVAIVATVNGRLGNPFVAYQLEISGAGVEDWQWLTDGEAQAWQAPIARWETTRFADGLYDLRLRIVYRDGNYDEYYLRNLSVANWGAPLLAFAPPVGITVPRNGATVSGVVALRGTVPDQDLLRWELAWSPGGRGEWRFVVSSAEPVVDDVLARLDFGALPSGLYDLRLRIVRSDTNYSETFVRGLRVNPGP